MTSLLKKTVIYMAFLMLSAPVFAQEEQEMQTYEPFKKDKELRMALVRMDMTPFVKDKVLFSFKDSEKECDAKELNNQIRQHFKMPKNTTLKKASESNGGWVQSFGVYKGEDALMFIRFSVNPGTGYLDEVAVEKN